MMRIPLSVPLDQHLSKYRRMTGSSTGEAHLHGPLRRNQSLLKITPASQPVKMARLTARRP